jgi:hypothetical protein
LQALLNTGGRALIDVGGGSHWILAEKMNDDGSVSCRDPSAKNPVTNRKRKSSDEGVALIPGDGKTRC